MTASRNPILSTGEPGPLLSYAVSSFGSRNNSSLCASKVHAHAAFGQAGPITLTAAPEFYPVTDVSLTQPERRRLDKRVLKYPYLERDF